ncbi:breast cancer type 2 susceptibility protein [Stegastes partitus]|uniref:Breast cancer type 2 susceptibility protein n=2 Tax=Stegastes partitus TaxID=144197 RepID=A0A9Y4JPD5_9TELE|nr:PREDICTED: breast cancer type 2 susceptibility protein [Stegastes partitus]
MEKSFPQAMGGLCLTPEQVLLQLKYRYDVEVDHSRRPALRKIMEKDDTAAKTMILCVCEIVSKGHLLNRLSRSDTKSPQGADAKVEAPSAVVWLTDGWYAIKAQLDEPLTAMLHKGRLAVGGKLIIHGAQLVGSQDACSPLEAPESLMLKICANSSRPARWDAKLGFHRDPRPFLLPVSCLYSNGGPVGCVDVIILRSYPIQWMERKPDGGVVFRSVRAEEKEARRYNSHKQKAMEILFAKIQAEFEKEEKGNIKPQRRRKTMIHQNIASLQDGEELYEAVGDDPAYLEAHLSERQLETLHNYRRSLVERKQAELQDRYHRALKAEDSEGSCPKRDVAPVWRLCIADSKDQPGSVYQLSLWRPPSDLQSLLKEGCRYKVYNLTTSDGKKRSSVETVQLTGTKKTQFEELQASQEWLSARFQPRVSTNFVNLQNPDFQPLCGEVDLTGYIISIIDGQGSSPVFYLADGNLNFVKVRCFNSLTQSGLEDVVKPNVLLALSNLQLRGQSMHPTPVVYAGDLTVFSTNPKEAHLQESLSQLKNLLQCHENFFQTAEEKLSLLIRSNGLSSITSPALQPQTPASAVDKRLNTKTSDTFQKPIRSLGSFTPVNRNPAAATSSTETDQRTLKRRRALDYLSRVPSPPPLPHLGSVGSPCVNKTFNPPRRTATPSTLKAVRTPAHKPKNSLVEDEWVHDEELAMIDTQALHVMTVYSVAAVLLEALADPLSGSSTLMNTKKTCDVTSMSQTEFSHTTSKVNPGEGESAEDCRDDCSSPDKSKRDRVLKEVGLTSTAFIGPAFPPVTTTAKSDIEDSLSEFYKELGKIDTLDGANGNPGKQDGGFVQPLISPELSKSKQSQHVLEENILSTRNSETTETDGYHRSSGGKQSSWSHWYHNEPYYPRRPRPGLDLSSSDGVSNQNQWHYPPPANRPPDPRFHRPPVSHRPPPPAFPNPRNPPPHLNPTFASPGMTNQYKNELHFPAFSSFPPPSVRSHPSQGFHRDSPHHFDRDEQACSYDTLSDEGTDRWSRDRKEEWSQYDADFERQQRFDEHEVWERRHHDQPLEDTHTYPPALVLILMRGLPGSGKSTMARELLSTGPSGIILSTDDYFAYKDGYHYEPGLLGKAHEWNQRRAKDALHDGRSPIIIDNTNIQAWEMKPYVKMALERGYKVDFCEPDTRWKFDPYELEKRNKHGVPHEKIAQMLDRFSFPISIDIVMRSQDPPHVNHRRHPEQPQMMRETQDFY